eukprot:TRINITY_DN5_c0_g1_i8.p3 TRINITY_DN5_c0_g1~~TRINITY_DN5_c0_g1_i8.p3  ORF type:complete len:147 (+),score=2.91 TRINITY_DN5_c0_g1_i8:1486-1926(+)
MGVKNPHAGRPRFPVPCQSGQGKSAPKARQRCVVDGKRINISVLVLSVKGGRRRLGRLGVGYPSESAQGVELGKSGSTHNLRHETSDYGHEAVDALLPGKASKLMIIRTVPQTDTGGQVENTKALERTRVKELGKIVPQLREKVRR